MYQRGANEMKLFHFLHFCVFLCSLWQEDHSTQHRDKSTLLGSSFSPWSLTHFEYSSNMSLKSCWCWFVSVLQPTYRYLAFPTKILCINNLDFSVAPHYNEWKWDGLWHGQCKGRLWSFCHHCKEKHIMMNCRKEMMEKVGLLFFTNCQPIISLQVLA